MTTRLHWPLPTAVPDDISKHNLQPRRTMKPLPCLPSPTSTPSAREARDFEAAEEVREAMATSTMHRERQKLRRHEIKSSSKLIMMRVAVG